ncbi:hypothetical protein GALMADRAFT_883584 [Galerina marginata CBS 339.88]|uniref:Uncharacterized protein n=1 Tax=Galerina marginata (strain CBS 339.88) TaxID=685588 RepID=A0A067SUA5_GALM3|nr:hypothetical protein GALMADRAFT_883584 [Galerina marginata CBS 339.88]
MTAAAGGGGGRGSILRKSCGGTASNGSSFPPTPPSNLLLRRPHPHPPTWFNIFPHAAILRTGNPSELVLCTLAAYTGILVALLRGPVH